MIQRLASEIVHHVDVQITVAIVVAKHRAQAQARLANPGAFGDIGERAVPVVVIELVRQAIARVEGGGDRFPGIEIPADV